MKHVLHKLISRSSLHQQLALTFSASIVVLAILSSIAITTLSSHTAQNTLVEQGRQATANLASQSTLALLYWSAENIENAVRETMAFPNVRGLAIYGPKWRILYAHGENLLRRLDHAKAPSEPTLESETDDEWLFVAPVYSFQNATNENESPFELSPPHPELLGFVRMSQGKDTLKAMVASIWKGNLMVSFGLTVLLLFVLRAIIHRVVRPLKDLADSMRRAQNGEHLVRANLAGPGDILEMEHAFNTMMSVLEEREAELVRTRDAALESARLKGEFAANVSHELRTPLNGILGMLELLSDMGLTHQQREYAEIAQKSGENLLGLINDILDFSKLSAGKLTVEVVEFSIEELFDSVLQIIAVRAREKGLELAYVIDSSIQKLLIGARNQIRQILINLAGNAVKFTEKGSVELLATIQEVDGDQVTLRVEVKDTGIGIAKEAVARIFQPFSQADGSTTRKYGGTGLGLAISRQLIEEMDGHLAVTSELGQGTSFWFTLPLKYGAEITEEEHAPLNFPRKMNVLIDEDDESQRRFIAQFLTRWEIEHEMVSDIVQARKTLREANKESSPFDAILIDQEQIHSQATKEIQRQLMLDAELDGVPAILMGYHIPKSSTEDSKVIKNVWLGKPIRASALFNALMDIEQRSIGQDAKSELVISAPSPHLFNNNVLVAEDDRASQQVMIGMLKRLGCSVTIVSDGKEAMNEVVRGTYDLVFMDCYMPNVNGFEATTLIRNLEADKSHIPIVALTADIHEEQREKCRSAGMDDFISKPIRSQILQEQLQKWCGWPDEPDTKKDRHSRTHSRGSEQHINAVILEDLLEAIGDGFSPMIALFLEDTPEKLRLLRDAIMHEESEYVEQLAHAVKGAARNIGADRLAHLAKSLEETGGTEGVDDQLAVVKRAFEEFDEVKAVLEHEIQPGKERASSKKPVKSDQIVLVVDDDRGARFILRTVLEEAGYRVHEASNGAHAMDICERCLPDLILIDAMMPVLDGFTTCSRIRELPGTSNLPILIVTALDDDQSIARAFSAGATDYITKPVHLAVLRQRTSHLLQAAHAQGHVKKLAYQDPLTGLPNRAMFQERFSESIGDTTDQNVALLFLDLNRFKLVNDSFGHEVGDLLLKMVAERLFHCVRGRDLVARFGGDEFTIVLNGLKDPKSAEVVANKIADALENPFVLMGREIFISASIGIVISPRDGTNAGVLVKYADTAMFHAKSQQATYAFYKPEMADLVSTRLQTEADLRRALANNEFLWYYQPIINLNTKDVIGVEALVRWNHPMRGQLSPAEFIPLAKETGLIREIGLQAIEAVGNQLIEWEQKGVGKLIATINISNAEWEWEEFPNRVNILLSKFPDLVDRIEFEITESTLMSDPDNVAIQLQQLRSMGAQISIDDFGTGYSSLSYLKKLPVDKLKIDQSFVNGIPEDKSDISIIDSILVLARNLGLAVVAEGINTKSQVDFFSSTSCEFAQGYYFARPMENNKFESWLRKYTNHACLDTKQSESNVMP